jgi:hypothetical protein
LDGVFEGRSFIDSYRFGLAYDAVLCFCTSPWPSVSSVVKAC